MTRLGVLLLAAMLAGCARRPTEPAPAPRYVVGGGYQAGGAWFYPRERFQYDETGLAAVLPPRRGLTANGEAADDGAMVAAHPTLQLPALVRVTNLETGLQAVLRVNDRGPGMPGRLIGLSPRAAALLEVGGAAPVRVQVEEGASLALREQLQGGPRLAMASAPRGNVVSETLTPPAGAGQSGRGRAAGGPVQASAAVGLAADAVPDRLPETVRRVAVGPVRLMLLAGSFTNPAYARQLQAKLAALGAQAGREGDRAVVRAGPYPNAAAADAALDQAGRAGVSDSRIVVE